MRRIERGGETVEQPGRDFICPPVNGTHGSLGGRCFGVQPRGLDLGELHNHLEDPADTYHRAERTMRDLSYEIQKLQDAYHAADERQKGALATALEAVKMADSSISDEAEDCFLDLFAMSVYEAG